MDEIIKWLEASVERYTELAKGVGGEYAWKRDAFLEAEIEARCIRNKTADDRLAISVKMFINRIREKPTEE